MPLSIWLRQRSSEPAGVKFHTREVFSQSLVPGQIQSPAAGRLIFGQRVEAEASVANSQCPQSPTPWGLSLPL